VPVRETLGGHEPAAGSIETALRRGAAAARPAAQGPAQLDGWLRDGSAAYPVESATRTLEPTHSASGSERTDSGRITADARTAVREHPVAVFGTLTAVGFIAGRFLKASDPEPDRKAAAQSAATPIMERSSS
jgi:hypothetical protein